MAGWVSLLQSAENRFLWSVPDVSLAQAGALARVGGDSNVQKKATKEEVKRAPKLLFFAITEDWLEISAKAKGWKVKHHQAWSPMFATTLLGL